MPYDEEPKIITLFKMKHHHNRISGHSWTEWTDEIAGYEVVGGTWMRSKHDTYEGAERELRLRKQILHERKLRGE